VAATADVARREAGGDTHEGVGTGVVRQGNQLSVDVPGGEISVLLSPGEGAGEGAGRPARHAGQRIALAAPTIETLGLDLVPGAGILAATELGARARLMFCATTAASRGTPSSAPPRVRRDRSPAPSPE
jgi:hypothetical protein